MNVQTKVGVLLLVLAASVATSSCSREDERGYDLCATDDDCERDLICMFQRDNALGVCTRYCDASTQCQNSSVGGEPVNGVCGPHDERGNYDEVNGVNVCVWPCAPRNDPLNNPSCGDNEYECFSERTIGVAGICIGRASE